MKTTSILGRIVLPNGVIEKGAVGFEDGVITYVGEADGAPITDSVIDCKDNIIMPGYVDIHCHASKEYFTHKDPEKVAEYHLSHGTTSMLQTIYRNIPHDEMLQGINRIKEAMKKCKNIAGVHLEGPYLNPMYGTGRGGVGDVPDYEKYSALIETGVIKQWTFAPEVPGTEKFCTDIAKAGIVPAVGHSKASAEQIRRAALNGAKIVTHLFDATGCALEPSPIAGTKEVDFDHAVLGEDNFYYEIICDKAGIHVRPGNVKLAVKAAGIDRIVGITDSFMGPDNDDDSDVTFINGDLSGSKLTMDNVARNFKALGYSLSEVSKICSLNPAKAIGIDKKVGSLEVGKRADILVLDENMRILKVFN